MDISITTHPEGVQGETHIETRPIDEQPGTQPKNGTVSLNLEISGKLKVRHIRDLERANKVDTLLAWLHKHSNIDNAIEEAILDLEMSDFAQFYADLLLKINQGIRLPKVRGGNLSPS